MAQRKLLCQGCSQGFKLRGAHILAWHVGCEQFCSRGISWVGGVLVLIFPPSQKPLPNFLRCAFLGLGFVAEGVEALRDQRSQNGLRKILD